MAALNQFTVGFLAIPSVNKHLVIQLARCEYVDQRENVIAVRNSGSDKTHVALGLGLAACQKGSVGRLHHGRLAGPHAGRGQRRTAPPYPSEEACPPKAAHHHRQAWLRAAVQDRAKLLFEVFSQRYERGSVLVTTNPPFDEWTEVFGSERLTGALLDRLTHRVHILEVNGESYLFKLSSRPPPCAPQAIPLTPRPHRTHSY